MCLKKIYHILVFSYEFQQNFRRVMNFAIINDIYEIKTTFCRILKTLSTLYNAIRSYLSRNDPWQY